MASKSSEGYDAVIVGASLAGCTAATLLGREGARVALVEKQPDPKAFKRMCSHFIQASAVPTLERLGWMEPIYEAGGIRTRVQAWTRWGWIKPPPPGNACVNLRREILDPLLKERVAAEPGVELMLGRAATAVLREGDAVRGVVVRTASGEERELRAPLTVGADGRDSKLAEPQPSSVM
ncbi:MAG: NAD(P)/FAD-dependent oxidoreductase [Solirubrobacterales bacterium]